VQLHAKVRKNAMWGTSLNKFAWRIDVKSKARAVAEMNEPVAIVELTLGKKVTLMISSPRRCRTAALVD
jgi:hypothetical protein